MAITTLIVHLSNLAEFKKFNGGRQATKMNFYFIDVSDLVLKSFLSKFLSKAFSMFNNFFS